MHIEGFYITTVLLRSCRVLCELTVKQLPFRAKQPARRLGESCSRARSAASPHNHFTGESSPTCAPSMQDFRVVDRVRGSEGTEGGFTTDRTFDLGLSSFELCLSASKRPRPRPATRGARRAPLNGGQLHRLILRGVRLRARTGAAAAWPPPGPAGAGATRSCLLRRTMQRQDRAARRHVLPHRPCFSALLRRRSKASCRCCCRARSPPALCRCSARRRAAAVLLRSPSLRQRTCQKVT